MCAVVKPFDQGMGGLTMQSHPQWEAMVVGNRCHWSDSDRWQMMPGCDLVQPAQLSEGSERVHLLAAGTQRTSHSKIRHLCRLRLNDGPLCGNAPPFVEQGVGTQ